MSMDYSNSSDMPNDLSLSCNACLRVFISRSAKNLQLVSNPSGVIQYTRLSGLEHADASFKNKLAVYDV